MRDELIKIYDPQYIDDEILKRVERFAKETEVLKNQLSTLGKCVCVCVCVSV